LSADLRKVLRKHGRCQDAAVPITITATGLDVADCDYRQRKREKRAQLKRQKPAVACTPAPAFGAIEST
jgi:hypothetical protein